MPRLYERGRLLLALSCVSIACTSRTEAVDPLHEMHLAFCESRVRCNCRDADSSECEAYARTRAVDRREHGAQRGAHLLDLECVELARAAAETLCVEGGIPYGHDEAELAAAIQRCWFTLFHGERRVGEPCEHPTDILRPHYSDCESGATCVDGDDGPHCVSRAIYEHEICFDIDAEVGCRPDRACVPVDADTSECQPLTRVGDPCAGFLGDYCEGPPGQWCDPATSTCQALPGPGEPCLDPSPNHEPPCAYDAACRSGRCERRPTAGEPCTGYGSCALGLDCTDEVCVGGAACY